MVYSLESYRYELPESHIAQVPADPPESAKLMVVDGNSNQILHSTFDCFPEHVEGGSLVFLNDTKVLPARMNRIFRITYQWIVREKKGEILYLNQAGSDQALFEAMVYPGDSFPIGSRVHLGIHEFETVEVTYQGRTFRMISDTSVMDMLSEFWVYPIPPYISQSPEAQEKYQTDFATHPGSLAAPTASLHFTHSLLARCEKEVGMEIRYATLHVGIWTFKIINELDIRKHTMHAEAMIIYPEIFQIIAEAKRTGRTLMAVWTTMVRYLESLPYVWRVLDPETIAQVPLDAREWWNDCSLAHISANQNHFSNRNIASLRSPLTEGVATAETTIFIYPGYRFGIVDEIVTNFHLPNSTLMPMISAFVGLDTLKELYESAKKEGYRFYSFGDGMYLRQGSKKIKPSAG